MTGTYDASGQVLVADRRLDGVAGYWVVTPLVVDPAGSVRAARIAVLRGFVTDGTGTGPAPSAGGPVTVTGTLAPGESPASSAAALPDGQLGSLDLARLVNRWPGDLYNAFVFATAETPDASPGVQRVPPPPLPTGLTCATPPTRCSGGSSVCSPHTCGGGWSGTTTAATRLRPP